MIRVVFEGSLEDVHQAMHAFIQREATSPAKTEKVATVPKKEKVAEEKAAPTEEKKAAEAAVATLNDVKESITAMLADTKVGKEGIIKLFAEHFAPAKKGSELKESDYPVFIAKAKALLA
jgi:4-aminobutyrate aminotransferase-like enzyme